MIKIGPYVCSADACKLYCKLTREEKNIKMQQINNPIICQPKHPTATDKDVPASNTEAGKDILKDWQEIFTESLNI